MSRRNRRSKSGGKRMSKKDKARLIEAANQIFDNLDSFNAQLELAGKPKVASIEDGVAFLSRMFINIFDFVLGSFHFFSNYWDLKRYTLSSHKVFPLEKAKSLGLRMFLVKFF